MQIPRLTTPLVRGTDGALHPATWEVALDRAARGIAASRDHHGSSSVGIFSCSKATNEVNYFAQKVLRVAVGSNNIDSCNRT
jgi:formate dehydrogenase (hydrogenase)